MKFDTFVVTFFHLKLQHATSLIWGMRTSSARQRDLRDTLVQHRGTERRWQPTPWG
jgi:hypothetical protein